MPVVFAAGHWWAFVVRGVLAVLFGVLTFVVPAMALLTLVLLFAVYAIVEGAFNVAAAFHEVTGARPRWWLLFAGAISVLAGVLAFWMPGLTALTLLYLIAAWAVVRGALEIAAAVRLRKEIQGEWLLAVAGVLSIVFGALVMAFPGAGALAVAVWIGAYAIVFGAILIGVGAKLRRRARTGPPGREFRDLAHGMGR